MKQAQVKRSRPDIEAAIRGGDWTQAMDGEGVPGHATIAQAIYWRQKVQAALNRACGGCTRPWTS